MGQEVQIRARIGGKLLPGRAYLETDHVLFRSAGKDRAAGKIGTRVKMLFKEIESVEARNGWLVIRHGDGSIELELGERAEKWAEKIRSPRSLLDKLGVKPGARVALTGAADEDFRREIAARGCEIAEGMPARDSSLIFFSAESREDLRRVKMLAGRLAPAGALWVIYPKGQKHITENDVLAGGRVAGLKDVKVVGFSATHTALKFVIPVAKR
jgi:hypothetical protein